MKSGKCWLKAVLFRQKATIQRWKEQPISFAAKTCVLVPSITPSGEIELIFVIHDAVRDSWIGLGRSCKGVEETER